MNRLFTQTVFDLNFESKFRNFNNRLIIVQVIDSIKY
jgi:hypothetical protein